MAQEDIQEIYNRLHTLCLEAEREGEVPIAALVTASDGRTVIAEARNEREKLQLPTAHAEVLALERAARALGTYRLEGCALWVTLEPCPMCLAVAQQARVKQVIYATVDEKGGAISHGFLIHQDATLPHRFEAQLEPDSRFSELLRKFFKGLRERNKTT